MSRAEQLPAQEIEVEVDDEPLTAEERLAQAMTAKGIAPASQGGAFRLLAGVLDGSIPNPRQAAKALGVENYNDRAASQVFLAARKLLSEDSPTGDFKVQLDPDKIV